MGRGSATPSMPITLPGKSRREASGDIAESSMDSTMACEQRTTTTSGLFTVGPPTETSGRLGQSLTGRTYRSQAVLAMGRTINLKRPRACIHTRILLLSDQRSSERALRVSGPGWISDGSSGCHQILYGYTSRRYLQDGTRTRRCCAYAAPLQAKKIIFQTQNKSK